MVTEDPQFVLVLEYRIVPSLTFSTVLRPRLRGICFGLSRAMGVSGYGVGISGGCTCEARCIF